MNELNGWIIKPELESTEGFCWQSDKVITLGLSNSNPLRLLLHEVAHIGINPHGNKHTQEWFNKYLSLMNKYMSGIDISESDKIIQRVYKLLGANKGGE